MTAVQFVVALVAIAVALCVIMAGAWMVQQCTGNSGWVDTIWTFGLGATGLSAALVPLDGDGLSLRQGVTAAFVAWWSLRLGLHIAQRSKGITNDPRYAEMARSWGAEAPRRMFWLLQKQAWVTIPLALAVFLAGHNPAAGFRVQDAAATVVLFVALGGEALADHQLRRFASNPDNKGKICAAGLWSWSRHPNYFFEWLGWLGYPLLAVDLAGGYAWGYLALLAPVCMYWLLVYVSGIPPLEAHMVQSRGGAFLAYQRRTSAFFPMPPAATPGSPP
jgi:steroid 5-alpha reductase family enzyme